MDFTFLPEPTETLSGTNSVTLRSGQIHSPRSSFGWGGAWMLKLHSTQDKDGWTCIEPPSSPSPRAAFEFKLPDNLVVFTSSKPKPLKARQHQGMNFFVALKDGGRYKPWPWPMHATSGAHNVAVEYLSKHSHQISEIISDMPLPATSLEETLDGRPVSPFLPLDLGQGLRERFQRERFFGLALHALKERTKEPVSKIKITASYYRGPNNKTLQPSFGLHPDQGNYQLQQKLHRPFLKKMLDDAEHPTSTFWHMETSFETLAFHKMETVECAHFFEIEIARPDTSHERLTFEYLRQQLEEFIATLPQEVQDLL